MLPKDVVRVRVLRFAGEQHPASALTLRHCHVTAEACPYRPYMRGKEASVVTLIEAQSILRTRGIDVSIGTLRRWARRGVFGGMMGKRERRYIMRQSEIARATHGLRADDMQRNGLTLRLAPVRR